MGSGDHERGGEQPELGARSPRRGLARLLLLLLYVPVALAVLMVLLNFSMNTSWFRGQLQEALDAALPGRIEYTRLALGFPPSVRLYGVRLVHPVSGRALVTADELHARLRGPYGAIPQRLHLSDIRLRGVTCDLVFAPDGHLTLLDIFVDPNAPPSPDEEPGAPFQLVLQDIDARDLKVRLQRPEVVIEVVDGAVQGSLGLDDGAMSIDANLQVGSGRVQILVDGPAPMFDIPVQRLDAQRFRWRGDGFSIAVLSMRAPGARVRASGALWLGDDPAFVGSADLGLRFEESFLQPLLGDVLQGEAELRGQFHGTMDHPRGTFEFRSRELSVPSLVLRDLVAGADLDGQQVDVRGLTTGVLGGRAKLTGSVRLLDGELDLAARLTSLAINRWLPAGTATELGGGRVSGRVQATARVWGAPPLLVNTYAKLTLDRSDRSWPVPRLLHVQTRARLEGDRLTVSNLRLTGGEHRLSLSGWLDLERQRYDLDLDLASGPLAPVLEHFGVADVGGAVGLRGRARGSLLDPGFAGQLVVDGLRVRDQRAERVEASLALASGLVTLRHLDARAPWGRLRLDAAAQLWRRDVEHLLPEPELQVTGQLQDVILEGLLPPELRVQGRGGGRFAARGRPSDLELRAALCVTTAEVRGLAFDQLEVQAEARLRQGGISATVERLAVGLTGGGQLEASGELSRQRIFKADVRAEGLPIQELERLGGVATGLTGRVGFGLHGEGELLKPRVSGDILLRELAFGPTASPSRRAVDAEEEDDDDERRRDDDAADETLLLGDAQIHVDLGPDQVLRVTSQQAFGLADVEALLPLQLEAAEPVALDRARARVAFERLPLRRLVPDLEGLGVVGHLSGTVEGGLPGGKLAVALQLSEVLVEVLAQRIVNRGPGGEVVPLRASFDGSRLEVLQVQLDVDGRPLSLDGSVTLADDGEVGDTILDLRAQGEVDLRVLTPFVPMLPRLRGQADFRLALLGSPNQPRLQGHLGLTDAGFQVEALAQELRIERGRLLFSPGRIVIPAANPLVGRLGRSGAFALQAEVQIASAVPLVLPLATATLRAERLRMSAPEQGVSLLVDVPGVWVRATEVLGPQRRLEVGGEVRLASGQFVRGFTDPEALAAAVRGWFEGMEESQGRSLEADHPLQALRLRDLKLSGEEGALQVRVQAAMLAIELNIRPDLILSGGLDDLRVTGTVETDDGDSLTLMDRKFRFTRSDIAFDGPLHPLIDIEAEAEVVAADVGSGLADELAFESSSEEDRTYHISLLLKGRLPDDLEKFELTSPQTNDQRELWTLILLGYRYSDLARAGGGDLGGEVLLSSALQILSQKLTQEALSKFRLVDQLSLFAQRQDVKVQVRKRVLGGKLELLGQGTFSGADSEQSLGAKLYLRDQLFLELSTTPGSDHNPLSSRLGWQVPLD